MHVSFKQLQLDEFPLKKEYLGGSCQFGKLYWSLDRSAWFMSVCLRYVGL